MSQEKQERLQKYISEAGAASRRRAEELIAQGKVKVNGRPAKIGDKIDPFRDLVSVEGVNLPKKSRKRQYLYLAVHKPRGFVTTMEDELGRKCIRELVKDLPERVYPVGRLDKDSEGLVLMTNDGAFANRMMHPRYHIPKVYRVTLRPDFTEEHTIGLLEGMELDGERLQPVETRVVLKEPGRAVVEMTLQEGKNRQIRRMCQQLGLEVARLKRIAVGPVRLGMLQPGEYRDLTKLELENLQKAMQSAADRSAGGKTGLENGRER